MPSTPGQANDDTVEPLTALPTPHTSCPPEDDREQYAPTEERLPFSSNPTISEDAPLVQMPTPAAEAESASPEDMDTTDAGETTVKTIEDGDDVLMRQAPSPASLVDDAKDSDARLAQSMSATALSSSTSALTSHSSETQRVSSNSTSSFLRPGSKFHGTQQSDRQVYNVQVEIKDVDMDESFLCGYLRIQGLTDDHPTLTTYFEGEIIGNKHTFKTAHPEWGSTEKVDMQHWARFPAWRPLAKQARTPGFDFKNFAQREHLFMRWKEYFLVPDHKVKTITGASFEGFYYICFNQCSGSVSGIYFHAKSEKYQQLELEHVNDRGCVGAMEFR